MSPSDGSLFDAAHASNEPQESALSQPPVHPSSSGTPDTDGWPCPSCTYQAPSFRRLRVHLSRVHSQKAADRKRPGRFDRARHSVNGMPTCRLCSHRFSRWSGLRCHIDHGHTAQPIPSQDRDSHAAGPALTTTTSPEAPLPTRSTVSEVPPLLAPEADEQTNVTSTIGASTESAAGLTAEPSPQPPAYQQSFQQQLRQCGWQMLLTRPDLRRSLKHHCPLCSQWAATPSGLKVHLQQSHPEWKSLRSAAQNKALVLRRGLWPSIVPSQSPRCGNRVGSPPQGGTGEDNKSSSGDPSAGRGFGDGHSGKAGAAKGETECGGHEVADGDGRVDLPAVEHSEGSARACGGPGTVTRGSPGVSDGALQARHPRHHQEVCVLEGHTSGATGGMDPLSARTGLSSTGGPNVGASPSTDQQQLPTSIGGAPSQRSAGTLRAGKPDSAGDRRLVGSGSSAPAAASLSATSRPCRDLSRTSCSFRCIHRGPPRLPPPSHLRAKLYFALD